ncbi:M48 family metallopeptidase [Sulfuriflexus mobilis]|uniref:M48 family metallopeptidase n=1 Tax=Sulfuriflexus mobilis TaxID=1811807 RepID=UPI000F83EC43|nr:M48 family metallopeptidase [Sulfuriflexus mobilis]
MDFFQSQETARRNTVRLVVFFGLAVLGLIVITNLLVMLLFGFLQTGEEGISLSVIAAQFDWQVFLLIGAFVSLVIFGGSAYKTMALSGGGTTVAESLGGRLISQSTTDLHERKALNVVEEMAIASGTPVPPVYLLEDEQGINAFAAGFTPGDAVIGLTRGTIAYLSREELQGVIAHEFSHILHGDMRLNIRLIGILHGILLLGLIGYYILRSVRGRSNKNTGPILGLGLGLLVIGYSGTFFGNLIKASVSRQREFLADASAVQFTRNNTGIAGALKKIGGYAPGSALETPEAPTMSHAYFSNGVSSFMQSMFATHPPLDVRIKRIDPHWDGVFVPVTHEVAETESATGQTAAASRAEARKTAVTGVVIASQILEHVGQTGPAQLDYAASLLDELPKAIHEMVHEPYGARAVIYCLVMTTQPAIQARQLQQLEAFADTGIFELVSQWLATVKALDIKFRLPLIDMALPSLRQLSAAQYQLFKKNLLLLMQADRRIDLFEWSLQKILFHHLDAEFGRPGKRVAKFGSLKAVKEDIDMLMSMLVYACVQDKTQVKAALASAEEELQAGKLVLLPRQQINIDNLGAAVDQLALLKPLIKPRLLKACLAVITQDQNYSPNEMELMRAIADVLDCPLPPYLG